MIRKIEFEKVLKITVALNEKNEPIWVRVAQK